MSDQVMIQRAAHLMWLKRRLEAHNRWLIGLILAWVGSVVGAVSLLSIGYPLMSSYIALPPEVTTITVIGVILELTLLALFALRVAQTRQQLQQEIIRLTERNTMSKYDPETLLQRIEARFTRRIWFGLHLLCFVGFALLTLFVARRLVAPLAVWAFLIMAHTIVFVLLESRDVAVSRFFGQDASDERKPKPDTDYEDYFDETDDPDNFQNRQNLN